LAGAFPILGYTANEAATRRNTIARGDAPGSNGQKITEALKGRKTAFRKPARPPDDAWRKFGEFFQWEWHRAK
jgi:hypothetical protein